MPWYDKPLKKIGLNSVPQRFNQVTDEWEIETTEADPVYDTEVLNKLNELDAKINGIIEGTTPANTKLTGSIVETIDEKIVGGSAITIPPSSYYETNVFDTSAVRDISVLTSMSEGFTYSVLYYPCLSTGNRTGFLTLLESGFSGNKAIAANDVPTSPKGLIRITNDDTTASYSLSYGIYGRR